MSKLRVVKDRRTENNEFHGDLRGLADKGLLENEYPWVFLAVCDSDESLINKVCEHAGLKHKYFEKEKTYFIFDGGQHRNHKSKSLSLFGAALLISKFVPTSKAMIAQIDTLKYKMTNQDLGHNLERTTDEYKGWKQNPGTLTIFNPVHIYLKQAGFLASVNSADQFTEIAIKDLDFETIAQTQIETLRRTS